MIDFEPAIKLLTEVMNDRTVPKNIRKAAEDSKNELISDVSLEIKTSTAIHLLDEIINDPNMPLYARTKIWNIVSILEQKRKEIG